MDYTYAGTELDLFASATVWKSYLRRHVAPFLGREVLEVGAGLGGTTRLLYREGVKRWVCLEPDAALAHRLARAIENAELPSGCEIEVGTLRSIPEGALFDTLLYIDVLEHIEDHRDELIQAARRLRPGGHLIVLSPAHQGLYTAFDRSIGHFRRYTKSTLRALTPPGCELVRLSYLDSIGLLASLGNRLVLRSALPTRGQIALWDKGMVRLSRLVDPLLGYSLGKSVLGVWRKVS